VIGAGGVYPPPEGYLAEVRAICRDNDVLFVADEVVTGFGRIGGAWFASTRFGLEPDIMTTAKGLTSGYQPMGAVFVSPTVAEPFFRPGCRRVVAPWLHPTAARLPRLRRPGRTSTSSSARICSPGQPGWRRTLHRTLAPPGRHPIRGGGPQRYRGL
jgi:hypothetical protein